MNRLAVFASMLLFAGIAGAQDLLSAGAVARAFAHRDLEQGAFIVRDAGGKAVCRDATREEALRINRRLAPVQVFGEDNGAIRAEASAGLHIILRGTAQLDLNPDAKAAFQHAAEIWESRIANPVTVYVDVDFGTTRFGEPFEEDVLASASSDYRGGNEDLFAPVRGLLAARSDSASETALYGLLPGSILPTDLGDTTRIASPSILLRVIGAIDAVADTADSAPTIGFNSAFPYDFDPTDGITAGKTDFEGVVVHEIGHMLGFVSRAGSMEIGSTINAPSIMDFFRFRPGVTNGTFQAAQRIQSSGGEQIFFDGTAALAMSTGRPDGTGGDQRQASHWKDDALTGTRIGIMDPTLSSSVRSEITDNDLHAFDLLGYHMVAPNSGCSEAEPNETTTNATTLSLPGTCGGTAAFNDASNYVVQYTSSSDGIEDVWKVTLTSSAKLHVNLTFSTGDLDVFLFSVSGSSLTILGSSNGSTNAEDFTTTTTLSPGTYYVGVSAYTGSSSYTLSADTVGGGGPVTVNAPTNLTAAPLSTSSIRLSWTDNSTNEEEFRVEQKTGATFTDIGAASANATGINVSGIEAGQSVTFRVRAHAGSTYSTYSNEATATTNSQPGTCTPSSTVVCLLSNRFRVSIAYVNPFSNPPNQPGTFLTARLVSTPDVNPDTGLFGFDSALAVEVVVRVQDTRPFAPRFDIYYGGMTDVEYTITVTDSQTGVTRTYHNNAGVVGGGVDRTSFPAN